MASPTPRRNTRPRIFGVAAFVLSAVIAFRFYSSRKAEQPSQPVAVAPAPNAVPAKPPATPYSSKHLYTETADPKAEIAAGLHKASAEHKRVILDFGGDWCGDCQVLDIYFHEPENLTLLESNFVVVHVAIGHMDKNLDVAERYGVPIKKGVPALAVLDEHGKLLYSQQTGQFEDMRHMNSQSVTDFLTKWKV